MKNDNLVNRFLGLNDKGQRVNYTTQTSFSGRDPYKKPEGYPRKNKN